MLMTLPLSLACPAAADKEKPALIQQTGVFLQAIQQLKQSV